MKINHSFLRENKEETLEKYGKVWFTFTCSMISVLCIAIGMTVSAQNKMESDSSKLISAAKVLSSYMSSDEKNQTKSKAEAGLEIAQSSYLIRKAETVTKVMKDRAIVAREHMTVLPKHDYENLLKIVSAEAGGEDIKGKILVANVVLNRMNDNQFPNTVTEVIYEQGSGITQFSPVSDGRINQVGISDETREAVDRALEGEDYSQGALYFSARDFADPTSMKWFDRQLTWLFQHGHHEFYK